MFNHAKRTMTVLLATVVSMTMVAFGLSLTAQAEETTSNEVMGITLSLVATDDGGFVVTADSTAGPLGVGGDVIYNGDGTCDAVAHIGAPVGYYFGSGSLADARANNPNWTFGPLESSRVISGSADNLPCTPQGEPEEPTDPDPEPTTPGNGNAPEHAGQAGKPAHAGQPGPPAHANPGKGNR